MKRLRVLQVITRWVRGGARGVVDRLLSSLPRDEFEQTLVCGPGEAPEGAVVVPDLVRDISPWTDLRGVVRLSLLFSRLRPEVVHAHTYKAGVLASVAGRLAGTPAVIFTPHGHIFASGAAIPGVPRPGWQLGLLRKITIAAQACADRVTALSDADLEQQLELDLAPASKYVVVSNGIDVDHFARSRPRLFGGTPVIGSVGRFTSEKGHAHLIDAFTIVRRSLADARLVLVGYGELEEELKKRAGGHERVTFAGECDAADVLPSFDLFVQPSLYESQGVAILEAMAAGRPVVATAVGGVGAIVQDEETGLLVPPGDPAALARALVRMARSPELRASLAERALQQVRDRFSSDRMIAAYAKLYRDVLHG